MSSNKKTIINVICSLMVLCTNVIVSFFLSPYIVKNIGVEANGFVTLANNFVTYAQLIVTALNSMAARYVAIAYVKKDYKTANLFYNSVFWGNLVIVAVLILPATYLIFRLENFVNISAGILLDVKLLFGFMFFNFFAATAAPNWDCGPYASNRLDRSYIPQMVTSIFKCLFLFFIFSLFSPKVYYVGVAATIVSITNMAANCYNTHVLTPNLKIALPPEKIICSKTAMKELVCSGIWNSISNVGNMLLSGLDLIICNLLIGPVEMGILSLSKILPQYMQQLSISIRGAFAPELTINYAKGDKEAIFRDIHRAMKLTSIVMTIPISIIVVMGDSFFALWVPSQDAQLLQILSILSILGYMFTSGTQILYNVFSTVNKVKQNAIAMLISGVASSLLTISLIKFTNLDIFAVAGVSTFCNLCRNIVFTLPATAKYLGFKWYRFYPQVLTTAISSIFLIVIGFSVTGFLKSDSWITFILIAGVLGVIGIIVNIGIVLNKEERKYLFDMVTKKFKPLLSKINRR